MGYILKCTHKPNMTPANTYYFLRIKNKTISTIKLIKVSALPLVLTIIGRGLKYHNANNLLTLAKSLVIVISMRYFKTTPHKISENENKYFPKLKKYF